MNRIVLMGTSEFAREVFQLFYAKQSESIVAIVTQPDRRKGRGKKMQATAIGKWANAIPQPLLKFDNINAESSIDQLAQYQPDIIVVVSYGQILKQVVLDLATIDCINVHASLLPRWRGAAPIQRAIAAGDTTTGISIMQMQLGLDTGAVMLQDSIAITKTDTHATLEAKLAQMGGDLLLQAIDQFPNVEWQQQNDANASYAQKISVAEAQINFAQCAEQLYNFIRSLTPKPASWIMVNNQRIKLFTSGFQISKSGVIGQVCHIADTVAVYCGRGRIYFDKIQYPGKKVIPIADFIRGRPNFFEVGQQL